MLRRGFINFFLAASLILIFSTTLWLYYSLKAPSTSQAGSFEISSGMGFRSVSSALAERNFIRSATAFELYLLLTDRATRLKPGFYELSGASSARTIANILTAGPEIETSVTIPEGTTAIEIDRILSVAGITTPGSFLELVRQKNLEGRLFPETYRFYFNSDPQIVLDKFLTEFELRAAPLLNADPAHFERNLILASILEKEVRSSEDRRIVAGLLIKRVSLGIRLQVDASICYIKQMVRPDDSCEPITALDKKIKSPYNTYSNSGWPPGAISNPGILAIEAALNPQSSPYLYYLSEPKEGKTIFARTLNEQVANQLKYLKRS